MRLAQQGTQIVIIILGLNLVFLGYLGWLLHEAQESAVEYERTTAIVTRANGLLKVFVDGTTTLSFYAVNRSEAESKKYDECVKQIEPRIQALRALVLKDKVSLAYVDRIANLARQASEQFTEAKIEMDQGEFVNFVRLRKKVMPILKKSMDEIYSFIVAEEKYASTLHPEDARRMTDQVRFFLLFIGIPMNVFLAWLAMGWFTRRISGRLDMLSENTKRLEAGEKLKPPLGGRDEIAALDNVFHKMADAIREAADKEKVATEFLKFSEQHLRMISDNMPVALITVDDSGTIDSVNPRAGQMFEYRADEFWKKNIADFFENPSQGTRESFMEEIKSKSESRPMELNAKTKTGGVVPTELSLKEFDTPNGKRYLATILDVTERHEMERLKREFVAMVSHDLRTPLMTVQGSLSLLAEGALGELPSEATKVASKAEAQIERLRDLVSNLLDLARIESGKFDVRLDDVLLMDIFENSADSVEGLAKESGIKVEVKHTDFEVRGDADRLVQVTGNLLSNAIKFSEPGSSVILSAINKDSDWIEVRVQDFGRGIPQDQKFRIFSRFEQVERDDSREKRGIGLGLSICQAIIEGHDGQIGVESEVGKGSTFWYRLRPVHADLKPSE